MNFNVYLDDHLSQELLYFCQASHRKRNTVIREAVEFYIQQINASIWPQSILEFKGVVDAEAFENFRDELGPDVRPHLF